MTIMHGLALLLSVVAGAFASQIPLDSADLHLSSLQSENFIALSHPKYPAHSLRIKKSNFCDPTVKYVTFFPLCPSSKGCTVSTRVISTLTTVLSICSSTFSRAEQVQSKVR